MHSAQWQGWLETKKPIRVSPVFPKIFSIRYQSVGKSFVNYFRPDGALPLKPRPPHAAGLNGGSESGFDPGPPGFESGWTCSSVAEACLPLAGPAGGGGVIGRGGTGTEVGAAAAEGGTGTVLSSEGGAIPLPLSAFPRTTSIGLSCPFGVIST